MIEDQPGDVVEVESASMATSIQDAFIVNGTGSAHLNPDQGHHSSVAYLPMQYSP